MFYKNINLFMYYLPLEIQRIIYAFDSSFHYQFSLVISQIKNLPKTHNFIEDDVLTILQSNNYDTMIVSDGKIEDYSNYKFNKKKIRCLNDGVFIVLDDSMRQKNLLRSNLMRELNIDGWLIQNNYDTFSNIPNFAHYF